MAKRKKKTVYTQKREALLSRLRRLKKQGIEIPDLAIPSTERQLRKAGVTGQKLARQTRLLKGILEGLSELEAVSKETGEIGTVEELRKSARKTRKKKGEYLPDGGRIIFINIFEDFISKVSNISEDFTQWSNKRKYRLQQAVKNAKTTLISVAQQAVSRDGISAVGWRLQNASSRIEELLQYVMYGSDSALIQSATDQIADIINGQGLTIQELRDLAEEMEANESYEI